MFWKKQITLLVLVVMFVNSAAKADYTFGEPTNLGPPINSSGDEWVPCISADGLEFYFQREEPDGEIYVALRPTLESDWSVPVKLGPTINTPDYDGGASISSDGLSLYLSSDRPGGYGWADLWVTTRATKDNDWGIPVNLGASVNTGGAFGASVSADELELYFHSDRPGGSGALDIWVTTRVTVNDEWATPVNLGPTINTSSQDNWPGISPDGILLFFASNRPGGSGGWDLYMARRATTREPWGPPINLGPVVNSTASEVGPKVSADGSTLYFTPTGLGESVDIWQASIMPIVDLNADGIIDSADICIMLDHWGTDNSLCDIGPMPWGDGIVDVQDLIVLAEHLFEEIPPAEEVEEAE